MRRLLNVITLLSLAACVVLCVGSFGTTMEFTWPRLQVFVGRYLIVTTGEFVKDPDWYPGRDVHWHRWMNNEIWFVTGYDPRETRWVWYLKLPDELTVPVTVAIPLFRGVRWLLLFRRFNRRIADGKCGRCGYDLRESPVRCPECGLTSHAARSASPRG